MPRSREISLDEDRRSRWSWLKLGLPRLPVRLSDVAVAALAAAAAGAILVNALVLQSGQHPAPLFAGKPAKIAAEPSAAVVTVMPRPRPPELEAAKPAATNSRTKGEIVTDIQKELGRKGFYDGAADGVQGPKTDAAIRDFEQAAGLNPLGEPSEAVLKTILRSPVRASTSAVKRNDSVAELIAPSKQVTAVQRALADFGYGQIKPSGVIDADTRAAIEKFERQRKLPITGQVSERVVRELAAMTGRTLN